MRLFVKEDIALPRDLAFSALADPAVLERQVLRRGVPLTRTDALDGPGSGMGWCANATIAGAPRAIDVTLTEWTAPERLVVVARSGGLQARVEADFAALSLGATRLRLRVELTGSGFRERMLLGTLRLSRSRTESRLATAVAEAARGAEKQAAGSGRTA